MGQLLIIPVMADSLREAALTMWSGGLFRKKYFCGSCVLYLVIYFVLHYINSSLLQPDLESEKTALKIFILVLLWYDGLRAKRDLSGLKETVI